MISSDEQSELIADGLDACVAKEDSTFALDGLVCDVGESAPPPFGDVNLLVDGKPVRVSADRMLASGMPDRIFVFATAAGILVARGSTVWLGSKTFRTVLRVDLGVPIVEMVRSIDDPERILVIGEVLVLAIRSGTVVWRYDCDLITGYEQVGGGLLRVDTLDDGEHRIQTVDGARVLAANQRWRAK